MSTSIDPPVSASCDQGIVVVHLKSGRELRFPVEGNPRLEGKSKQQLNNIELSPFGLHWPDLDEDLSIRGIADGDYGQASPRSVPISQEVARLPGDLVQIVSEGHSPARSRPAAIVKSKKAVPTKRAGKIA